MNAEVEKLSPPPPRGQLSLIARTNSDSGGMMMILLPFLLQVIRSNNTLVVFDANPADSATYTCEADNGYGRASDSATVTVENVYVSQVSEGLLT